jgi:hypothetical protein
MFCLVLCTVTLQLTEVVACHFPVLARHGVVEAACSCVGYHDANCVFITDQKFNSVKSISRPLNFVSNKSFGIVYCLMFLLLNKIHRILLIYEREEHFYNVKFIYIIRNSFNLKLKLYQNQAGT